MRPFSKTALLFFRNSVPERHNRCLANAPIVKQTTSASLVGCGRRHHSPPCSATRTRRSPRRASRTRPRHAWSPLGRRTARSPSRSPCRGPSGTCSSAQWSASAECWSSAAATSAAVHLCGTPSLRRTRAHAASTSRCCKLLTAGLSCVGCAVV